MTRKRRTTRKKNRKRSFRKIILWLLAVIVLIVSGIFAATYYYGSNALRDYLVSAVNDESKGLYSIRMRGLYIDLFTGKIKVTGFKLTPDTAVYRELSKTDSLSPILVTASVENFQVQGIDLMKALLDRDILVSMIIVRSPAVQVVFMKPSKRSGKGGPGKNNLTLPLPKGLHSVVVQTIVLTGGRLTLIDQTKTPAQKFVIPSLEVEAKNIVLDPKHSPANRIFNADDIHLEAKGVKFRTKNTMYTVSFNEIGLSTANSSAWVKDLRVKPNYPEEKFSRVLGYQADRFDITIREVRLSQLDVRGILLERKLIAGKLTVDGMTLEDYRDKRIPLRPDFRPLLPQQALVKARMYIRIDSALLMKSRATYREQVNDEPGSIYFDRISASVAHLTNDPDLIRRNIVMKVRGKALVMGKGLLEAEIRFPLKEKNDAFSFSGTLSRMDLCAFNPMLTKLIPAKIESGYNESMVISAVHADNDLAVGELAFSYSNLRVNMVNGKPGLWNSVKTGVLGLAASTFIQDDNPTKNGKFRTGIIYFRRDKSKGFFNFLWKSTFSGLKSTMGMDKKEQKEMKKSAAKKQY
jgi:hypothetical protein